LLVSWCAGGRCDMTIATRIVARVGHLMQMIEDGHAGRVLGGWMIGRLGDDVCGLYRAHEDEKREFLG
jgi:hypothetical protein